VLRSCRVVLRSRLLLQQQRLLLLLLLLRLLRLLLRLLLLRERHAQDGLVEELRRARQLHILLDDGRAVQACATLQQAHALVADVGRLVGKQQPVTV
jgi:hypothetical protein